MHMPIKKSQSLRHRLREIVEPYIRASQSSVLSLVFDVWVLLCIVASIALIPLEFLFPNWSDWIWSLELAFTLFFTFEYLLRWYASEDRLTYPFGFMAIVDLLAIAPTLMLAGTEFMAFRALRGIRLLRLLRLVRVLRFFRYGVLVHRAAVRLRIRFSALVHVYHLRALGKIAFIVVAIWVIGANLLHVTELHFGDASSPYLSYWRSYWNVIIVLISGIEDKEPSSLVGRIEVTALMILGILTVGMLTAQIVSILVTKVQRAGRVALKPPLDKLDHHIVILGRNRHLDQIVRQVVAALHGQHFVLVVNPDADQIMVTDRKIYRRVFALVGDPSDQWVLQSADIDQALRVIILSDAGETDPSSADSRTIMRALAVLGRKVQLPLVAELQTDEGLRDVSQLDGAEFVLSGQVGGRLLAHAVLNPGMSVLFDELLNYSDDSSEFYRIPLPPKWQGQHFSALQAWFVDYDDEALVLVGLDRSPATRPGERIILAPLDAHRGPDLNDPVLLAGDQLLLMATSFPQFSRLDLEDLWQGKSLRALMR